MHSFAVDNKDVFAFPVSAAEDLQPFSHTVRRIANDPVKQPRTPERRVRQVGNEVVQKPSRQAILLEIADDVPFFRASDAACIDIRAKNHSTKVRTRNGEAPGPYEGVVEDLAGSDEREVCGDETELGVHGRRTYISPRLETVSGHGVSVTPCNPSAKMDPSRRGGSEIVVFENTPPLLWTLHLDGPVEVEVIERFYQSALLRRTPFALVGVDVEAEGAGAVLRPFGQTTVPDLDVEVIVGCCAGPEFVDVLTKNTAPYKGTGCVFVLEPYDAEWRLFFCYYLDI